MTEDYGLEGLAPDSVWVLGRCSVCNVPLLNRLEQMRRLCRKCSDA